MVTTVYRIDTFPISTNAYGVSRDESWVVHQDKTFQSLEEAKDYVRERSRLKTDLVLFLARTQDPAEKKRIIDEFCFHNDTYQQHRRFFIERPDITKIAKALHADGVQVSTLRQ